MQVFDSVYDHLFECGVKASTRKQYDSQLNQYRRFCEGYPADWLWSDLTGVLWIKHAMEVRDLAKSALQGKIAAFKYGVAKYTKRQVEVSNLSFVHVLSRAIKQLPDTTQRKYPIGANELKLIFFCLRRAADIPGALQLELWAWWVLSYFALLRGREVAGIR